MKKLLPFALLVLLPFLLYWKLFHPVSEERRIFRGDFLSQHFIWKSYVLTRAKTLELPLWNPHVLGGEAFHANPQAGIFYPPTYLLLPFHSEGRVSYVALEAYQLLHQAFAGLGMFLFLRSLGAGTLGSLASAVIFPFTGFFTTPGHQAIVLTASFLPWVLLGIRRLFEKPLERSPARSISLAIGMALMILAGHPQVAYYGLLLAGAYALFEGGVRATVVRFLPLFLLAIAIASVQLLPTYDLAADSSRTELGYDYSTSFGFSPYFLPAILAPRGQVALPGQDSSTPLHVYVGAGALLFGFLGLFFSRSRARLFFAAAALVALLLSFGRDSALYDLLYAALPGLASFRVPYRILGIWTLASAVLSGLGLGSLLEASRKDRLRFRAVAKGTFVALLAVWLWAGLLHTRLLSGEGGLGPVELERIVGSAEWLVLLLTLYFLLFLLYLWRPGDRYVLPAIVVLLVLDMAAFVKDRAQHPATTLARTEERPVHRFLNAQRTKGRYATTSDVENYSMLFGTEAAGGHAALVDSRYHALLDEARGSANALSILNVKLVARSQLGGSYPWCGARFASPSSIVDVPPSLSPARFFLPQPLAVSQVVFHFSPLGPGGAATVEIGDASHAFVEGSALPIEIPEGKEFSEFQVVVGETNPGVRLEEIEVDLNPIGLKSDFLEIDGMGINLHTLPRAYFIASSAKEEPGAPNLPCWTVHQAVRVTDPETGRAAAGFFRKDAGEIVSYEPERVEIATDSPREGFVVLSDTYRPGWTAAVDGREAAIWRAQSAFRAVEVPAGKHQVVFRYRPGSLRLGAALSLLALGILAGWPLMARFLDRRRPPTSNEIP